jgi:Tfp pilus assembly protein PilE
MVVAILAILAAIALPAYPNPVLRSKIRRAQSARGCASCHLL